MKPYYQDDAVTIYHGDSRNVLPNIEGPFVFLTDPVYGIEGGKGGQAKRTGKGKYESAYFEDNEKYITEVCAPIIQGLLSSSLRGAMTPGSRHMSLYPKPNDVGCFWTPAGTGRGAWGFSVLSTITAKTQEPE